MDNCADKPQARFHSDSPSRAMAAARGIVQAHLEQRRAIELGEGGAMSAGFEVSRIEVAALDFPFLHKKSDWDGPLPATLTDAQATVGRADHLVLLFPLWLGTMPAIVKAFLEQILRPGFAFHEGEGTGRTWKKGLRGKSGRIVVTMGMHALIYRWYFGAHGVKGLERNILKFCGVSPVRETYIGLVESSAAARKKWIEKLQALGRAGR